MMRAATVLLLLAASVASEAKESAPLSKTTPRLRHRHDRHSPQPALHLAATPLSNLAGIGGKLGHISYALRRSLIVDETIRGRDQRRMWLRFLSSLHPRVRTAILLVALGLLAALWLRPGWHDSELCIPMHIALIGPMCRAMLAALFVGFAVGGAVGALFYRALHGVREELKDSALSDELLHAAMSCAAYEEAPAARIKELESRGVESRNWAVDDELSTISLSPQYSVTSPVACT